MAKSDEINYIRQVASIDGLPEEEFRKYLLNKPFSDTRCGEYLMDMAQVMKLLPPPPARLLDVGVGSGWTSALFASRGYDVLGLDINPEMIELALQRGTAAKFAVCDYEVGPIPGGFDVAVVYDALHHAENEASVVKNIYASLSGGGMLITVEPGAGHSRTVDSLEVMRKYGTTEKDMPYNHQRQLMLDAGFGVVEQYLRLSQLPVENIAALDGALKQARYGISLAYESATGLTSVVVARKIAGTAYTERGADVAASLMSAAVAYDEFVNRIRN